MLLNENRHGGNLARAAREYGLPEQHFIDFSASINPLGPSPGVFRAITENLWRIRHYPDPDCGDLRALLAGHLGVPPDSLVLGNGGAELIYMLPGALDINRALVVAPTFSEYAAALKAAGREAGYFYLPLEGDAAPFFDELKYRISDCDAIFICNPNNPTGRLFQLGLLTELVEAAVESGVTVVVDEAFIDFVDNRGECSLMPLAVSTPGLVVLYSLTKFFGVPGLRLGAAVANPELALLLNRARDPWSVNALAQVAGRAALLDKEHMKATFELVCTEREYLFSTLSALPGIKPLRGAANFLLLDISGTGKTVGELIPLLGRQGILVRDCSNFQGLNGQYIRIAVRNRTENVKLIASLRSVLGG